MEMNKFEEKLKELEDLQNDFKLKYEHISNVIEELKSNKSEIKINKDFRKRLVINSIYHVFDYGSDTLFCGLEDDYSKIDKNNFENYNYFETEKEAVKYAKITQNNLKVLQTLEYINGDWKPDWTDGVNKYCIHLNYNTINEYTFISSTHQLIFQSEEKRKEFRELITDEEIKLFLNPLGDN